MSDRFSEALARLTCNALADGDGERVGVLGDSGFGKTHAMLKLTARWTAPGSGRRGRPLMEAAFVLDDKGRTTKYAGHERVNVADLRARPASGRPAVVIFRGDPRRDIRCTPEEIAQLQFGCALRRPPVTSLSVFDELERAVGSAGRWREEKGPMRRLFGEGRALGMSSLWGTQSPQTVPREAFEQSRWLLLFHIAGRGLDYLVRLLALPDAMARRLPTLQRGEFALSERGQSDWDESVYRFAP